MTRKEQLEKLRDFLVPSNGPSRLVENWRNLAEDSYGRVPFDDWTNATNFCVVGAVYYLFNVDCKLGDYIKSHGKVKRRFWFGYKPFNWVRYHTANQIRDMLNDLIAQEE